MVLTALPAVQSAHVTYECPLLHMCHPRVPPWGLWEASHGGWGPVTWSQQRTFQFWQVTFQTFSLGLVEGGGSLLPSTWV